MNYEDLNKYKVTQLKDMLKNSGLKVSGRKTELVDRLLKFQDSRNLPVSPSRNLPVSPSRNLPVSPSRNLPVSPSRNLPVSPSRNLPVSPSRNLPVSPSRNLPVSPTEKKLNQFKKLPKDIVLKLMNDMDDRSLFNFCKTNDQKDIEGILYCNNVEFWRKRLWERYGEFYPENSKWKDFYLKLTYYLNKYGERNAFVYASANGHLDILKYLIYYKKIEPSLMNNGSIKYAAENGHLHIIEFLINLGDPKIRVASDNNYAIRLASAAGHLNIVKYLMNLPEKYNVDPSAVDNFALKYSAVNGKINVVKYLLKLPKKYNINPRKYNDFFQKNVNNQYVKNELYKHF